MKQEKAKAAKQRLRPVLEQNDPPTIGTAAGVKYDKPNRAPFIFFYLSLLCPSPTRALALSRVGIVLSLGSPLFTHF